MVPKTLKNILFFIFWDSWVNVAQDRPNVSQDWLETGPRWPKIAQDRHKMAQDRLKPGPRWPKTGPRRPKTGSR